MIMSHNFIFFGFLVKYYLIKAGGYTDTLSVAPFASIPAVKSVIKARSKK